VPEVESREADADTDDLLRVGMEVLLKSGQTGRVTDINGRIITVDTANGPRVYDRVNVFPMVGADDDIGEPVHPAVKQQIIDEHYQEKAAEREARRLEMAARREAALSTPLPTGKYRCLVIDPPWPVQKIERDVRPNQDAHLDYPTMSMEDIQALPIGDLADEGGCHLYLWTTQKYLPDALRMLEAWEFEYQCVMPWVKPSGMTPYSWMYNVEFVVFGRRGGLPLLQNGLKLSIEAASEGHSIKPDAFYQKVLLASPEPRLDMFARRERDGFAVWGDEVQEAS
jgi:N6-adenosine-specific RNA methylase IME4